MCITHTLECFVPSRPCEVSITAEMLGIFPKDQSLWLDYNSHHILSEFEDFLHWLLHSEKVYKLLLDFMVKDGIREISWKLVFSIHFSKSKNTCKYEQLLLNILGRGSPLPPNAWITSSESPAFYPPETDKSTNSLTFLFFSEFIPLIKSKATVCVHN